MKYRKRLHKRERCDLMKRFVIIIILDGLPFLDLGLAFSGCGFDDAGSAFGGLAWLILPL